MINANSLWTVPVMAPKQPHGLDGTMEDERQAYHTEKKHAPNQTKIQKTKRQHQWRCSVGSQGHGPLLLYCQDREAKNEAEVGRASKKGCDVSTRAARGRIRRCRWSGSSGTRVETEGGRKAKRDRRHKTDALEENRHSWRPRWRERGWGRGNKEEVVEER